MAVTFIGGVPLMGILGLILIGTGVIILFVAIFTRRQVPKDYDYDSDDGFIDLLNMMSSIIRIAGILLIVLGIIFLLINQFL